MVRAAMEGVAYTLTQLIIKLEKVYGPIKEIAVSGGFVQSSFWVQLISHVTGKKINVAETADASAMGAAYLGMFATGHLEELSDVKQFVRITKVYEPDPSIYENYVQLFGFFDSLYPRLKDDFATLTHLQEK